MSSSDETKQMQAAARASLNILFNRLTETIKTAEKDLDNSTTRIALSTTVAEARQAISIITGKVGHLRLSPEGRRARALFALAVDNFNKCIRYPEELWGYQQWQESFRVQCNMVVDTLEKLRIVCMPEELVLLEAGILQGLGMRFSAFDRDLFIERDEAQAGSKSPTTQERAAKQPKEAKDTSKFAV